MSSAELKRQITGILERCGGANVRLKLIIIVSPTVWNGFEPKMKTIS